LIRRPTKRFFDVFVAGAALTALAPILLVLAAVIRAKLGAPVLFSQVRPGLGGAPFRLIKFRSMTDERDSKGRLLPDEQRLTRLGSFLRRTSLDELPGLLNVIKGDMSLVGPRPLLAEYLPLYTERQARRHEVPPGLTGWAQINGRNAISWEEKFEFDIWYVENQSLWLDLRILWRTVWYVFEGRGITQQGHVTTEPFRGAGS
jgi:lipopolysaccharide/colanic/teichoic acid biosynthesis glycosyltransferase